MSGRIATSTFCSGCNEQIEAVVRLPEEDRSVIFGTVLDKCGNPVVDAVVKLLQVVDGCKYPYPLTHTFTDCFGQFLLGPLCPDSKYMLKIYKDNILVKYMPLDVECFDGECIGKEHCGCKGDSKSQGKSHGKCEKKSESSCGRSCMPSKNSGHSCGCN